MQGGQALIGGMDVHVARNFFGAQVHSFEMAVAGPPGYTDKPYNAVFIRAPAILSAGPAVQVLCRTHCVSPAHGLDPQDVIIAAQQVRWVHCTGHADP